MRRSQAEGRPRAGRKLCGYLKILVESGRLTTSDVLSKPGVLEFYCSERGSRPVAGNLLITADFTFLFTVFDIFCGGQSGNRNEP